MKLREALDTYMFDNVGQFGGIAESLAIRPNTGTDISGSAKTGKS